MEWLKKLLESQGLSEEQIKTITEGVENNYKGYVPEHRFEEINSAKKQAENDLKERDKQLEKLRKSAGDNEALQGEIKKLQDENKAAADKYAELQFNTTLKLAFGADVHDIDYAISQLDKSQIKLKEDGTIESGFDEQVKALRESKAFLFVENSGNQPPTFKGAKPPEGSSKKNEFGKKPSEMNYEELCAYMEANPGAEI